MAEHTSREFFPMVGLALRLKPQLWPELVYR